MMNWMKKKLRVWLAEPESQVDELDCILGGRCRRMQVTGVRGVSIIARDAEGEYLIGSHQAVEPKLFWRAWEQRTPVGKYTWPDGTPFKPGGQK